MFHTSHDRRKYKSIVPNPLYMIYYDVLNFALMIPFGPISSSCKPFKKLT